METEDRDRHAARQRHTRNGTPPKRRTAAQKRGRKAVYGAGSVFFIASEHRWCAKLTIDGKEKRRYAQTEEGATAKLVELHRLKEDGQLHTRSDQTLEHFLASWLQYPMRDRLAAHAWITYRARVRNVTKIIGHVRLCDLTAAHLDGCYAALLKKGYSGTLVYHSHVLLSGALKYAVRKELIDRNPADRADPPKRSTAQVIALTAPELAALLRTAAGTRWHALWALLGIEGLRSGEACALTWPDLTPDYGQVHVHGSRSFGYESAMFVKEPKTRASNRKLLLTSHTAAALRKHKALQNAERMEARRWERPELIFPNVHGDYLHSVSICRALDRNVAAAGVPRVTPHGLRHTAATIALANGENMRITQERLGHSDVGTTLRIYAHVTPAMHQEAADRMDALMTRAMEGVK